MVSHLFGVRFRTMAVSTVVVALLTLIFGALTTSKNAGMAFRDWPNSDGHSMLLYPWLNDFAKNWDKFLEHGHRLSGMLIGIWSIALVVAAFKTRQRKSVKLLSVGVLAGVICQGLLGGVRVLRDLREVAMMHGGFAALVFTLMGATVVLSGKHWSEPERENDRATMTQMQVLSFLIVALFVLQYFFGALLRHQGRGLHEHLGVGVACFALIFVNFTLSFSSQSAWLRRSSISMLLVVSGQVVLGALAWIFRFGFTPTGMVAVADSIQQVGFRTAHTVWGIVTFQAAALHLLRVNRVASVSEFSSEPEVIVRPASSIVAGGGQK